MWEGPHTETWHQASLGQADRAPWCGDSLRAALYLGRNGLALALDWGRPREPLGPAPQPTPNLGWLSFASHLHSLLSSLSSFS